MAEWIESAATETCCCGAKLTTSKHYTAEFAKFREAHAPCREHRALQSTLDSQVARCAELETALRRIADHKCDEPFCGWCEEWAQEALETASSPIPSERDS